MTTEFTTTLRLNKPDFRDPGWSPLVNDNFDNIDRAIAAAMAGANFEPWANNTHWDEGQIAIDVQTTPSSYWICNVSHTSAVSPTTFAADRAAHPTYWTAFLFSYRPRGAWTHDTQYLLNDIVYDTTLGITGICKNAHVSNHAGTINDDAANWDYIVNLPTSLPAAQISYDPTTSGLGVTNVQAAIDSVDATNDTQNTRLTSLESSRTTDEANIATNTTDISTLQGQQAKDGWDIGDVKVSYNPTPRSGWVVMNDGTIGNAISGGTLRANADQATLFGLIWSVCSNADAPVSGGRGASAAADFAANKTITVPKALGRAIIGVGTGAGLSGRNPGNTGGEETHIDVLAEMPNHGHGGNTGTVSNDHTHVYVQSGINNSTTGGGGFAINASSSNQNTGGISANHTHPIASQGSGSAHNNMQPWTAMYFHIRAY
jgi:microcystin-dependent protein